MAFAVMVHELAHGICASLLGLRTEGIELNVFGGTAVIRGIDENYAKEAVISAAGPLISLSCAVLWQMGTEAGILFAWDEFIAYSKSIAIINLLPIYPLDGGRIFASVMKSLLGEKRGGRYACIIGIVMASVMLINAAVELILFYKSSTVVMAVFIFAASLKAIKKPRGLIPREIYWKSEQIRLVKVYRDESLIRTFDRFIGDCFYMVAVFDNDERCLGILTEKDVYEQMLKGYAVTFKDIKAYPLTYL